MSAMQWTKELPKIPGWYWHRTKLISHEEGGCRRVVLVVRCGSHGDTLEALDDAYDSVSGVPVYRTVAELEGEWAGPIPGPQEPGEEARRMFAGPMLELAAQERYRAEQAQARLSAPSSGYCSDTAENWRGMSAAAHPIDEQEEGR